MKYLYRSSNIFKTHRYQLTKNQKNCGILNKCAQQYLLLDEQRFEIQISNYTDHEVDFKKRSQLYLAPIDLSSLTTDGNTIIKMAQIDVDEIRMTVVKAKEFFKLLTTVFIPHYFKEIESIFSVDIEPVSTIRDENYFFELSFKSSQSSQESLHVLQKDVANNSEHVITILASEMEDISRKLKEIIYETESSQNNSSSHHSAPSDIKSREIHNSTKPPYCGECKQIGHVFRYCPLAVCKKCRKTGHIRIDCHDYNGQREKEEYNDDEHINQFTSANSASSFEVADNSKWQTHSLGITLSVVRFNLPRGCIFSIKFKAIGKHDDYFNLNIETAENLCYAIETIFIPAYSYASESNNKIPDDLSNIYRRVGDTREYNFSLLEEQGKYYLWLTEHHNLNKHEEVQHELKRKVKTSSAPRTE
uniref:CCHC-type domain-containing protein n=1 Tax=Ditylenchus dipsaci TaxID=166011 RepID=A0A915E471_9BILA